MDYHLVAGLVSAEGRALSAVKPWFSFQCTGIHHVVRAQTFKGDEHLTYALIKSMAPLPFVSCCLEATLRARSDSGADRPDATEW